MKRILPFLLAATVPFLLGLKVWQVHRTQVLLSRIESMDQEQREWLERNKRLLSAIAVFRSPARIERLAREYLGLQPGVEPDLRVELPTAGGLPGGEP